MKLNLWQAIVLLAVAFALFMGVQAAVAAVNPATLPPALQGVWIKVVYIISAPAMIIAFTFLRNILGYLENQYQGEQTHYEAKRLAETLTKFSVYIYGFTGAIQALTVGTSLSQYAVVIAGAIGLVMDIVLRTLYAMSQAQKAVS
jgi:hypothetical protein